MKTFKLEFTRFPQQFLTPLYRWSQAEPGSEERNDLWDTYCDTRDQVAPGTSRAHRLANEEDSEHVARKVSLVNAAESQWLRSV